MIVLRIATTGIFVKHYYLSLNLEGKKQIKHAGSEKLPANGELSAAPLAGVKGGGAGGRRHAPANCGYRPLDRRLHLVYSVAAGEMRSPTRARR